MDGGRINIAACSVGGAQFCLDYARRYVQERQQFGQPLGSFQSIEFRIADMATALHASRLLVHRAAQALDAKVGADSDVGGWGENPRGWVQCTQQCVLAQQYIFCSARVAVVCK